MPTLRQMRGRGFTARWTHLQGRTWHSKIRILLRDFATCTFATGTQEKILYALQDFVTGAHPNIAFAIGFRFRNPREILYLLGGIYNSSPPKYCFSAMGFRSRRPTEIVYVVGDFITGARLTTVFTIIY